MTGQELPLAGIRVVEIGRWIAAPAAGRILKEWGADVTKVEPLTGDPLRGMSNPARIPDTNPPFEMTNSGKRSIAIDLRTDAGRDILLRLVRTSDVLITNLQPLAAEGLRVDYASLAAENHRLIYCAVSGYGLTGSSRDRPAFDGGAFWAASGMGAMVSEGLPEPVFPRAAVGDHSTAMSAVAGICAALVARSSTGRGQMVHTSLVGNGVYQLSWDYSNHEWVGRIARSPTRTTASNPLNSYYECGDGSWLALVALQSDAYWPGLCKALDLIPIRDDPRFASASARSKNAADLIGRIGAALRQITVAEAGRRLDGAGVIWAPLNGPREVLGDPDLRDLVSADCQVAGAIRRVVRVPVEFSATEPSLGGDVPEVGQHTEEILLELGFDWDQIIAAKEGGTVI